MKEFKEGYKEVEGKDIDLQELDDAYEEGLDSERTNECGKRGRKTMALDPQDLEGRIEDVITSDEYKPKMGKDDAVIVATFKVFGKQPHMT